MLRQIWRFREYGRHELRTLLLGLLMRVGELLTDLATPWPLALLVDYAIKGHQPTGLIGSAARLFGPSTVGMLGVAALAVLVITSVAGVFDYLGDRLMNSAGERITSAIRRDVFAHVQRLPMSYHDRQTVGELTSRVNTDTGRIEDSLVDLFATFIPGVLSLAGLATVLMLVDWRLGLVGLCAAPLVFFTAARYSRITRVAARRRRAAEGMLAGFVTESLRGIRTVMTFGRQDLHDRRFRSENAVVLGTGLRAVELRARFVPMLELVAALGTAALLFIGGTGVLYGWWTVGVLIVVTSYLRDLLKPMKKLAGLAMTFTRGAASAERLAAILAEEGSPAGTDRQLPERVAGEIRLRRVSLDYGRGPVLRDVDLLIRPSERIVLLGHNGAGKSSLLSLISGLYLPTAGEVLLDGLPLAELPDWWRHRQVTMVLQDTFLFSGTIAENIRYGRPTATDEEVMRVAEAALVSQFTDQLPQGLDTELNDGGIGLSGGQRQRVGIARAMLADAPVVLLDEPTTALDAAAEELVVRALTPLMIGRTVVMTTHRPALIRLATRIVNLRGGRVVGQAPAGSAPNPGRPGPRPIRPGAPPGWRPRPLLDGPPLGRPPLDGPPLGRPPLDGPPLGRPPLDGPPLGRPPLGRPPPDGPAGPPRWVGEVNGAVQAPPR